MHHYLLHNLINIRLKGQGINIFITGLPLHPPPRLKGNKGQIQNFTSMQNSQLQDMFVKGVLFSDMKISEILTRKIGIGSGMFNLKKKIYQKILEKKEKMT